MMIATQDNYGGVSVNYLIQRYSSPLYVYDLEKVYKQMSRITSTFGESIKLFYSLKANPNPTLVKLIYEKGTNLELSSPLELELARRLKVNPKKILYLGPGKKRADIEKVLQYGVHYFVAESEQELELINQISAEMGLTTEIGIRVNPDLLVKGARLQMGGAPRQFGIDEKYIDQIIGSFTQYPNLQLTGLHVYHGTRILSSEVIYQNTQYILQLFDRYIHKYNLCLSYVGVGGGLGVAYFDGETDLDLEELAQKCKGAIHQFKKKHPSVDVLMESGRYIVAESGVYLSKVLYTKKSKGFDFATIDGGTHHFGASGGMSNVFMKNFPIRVFSKTMENHVRSYHISGVLCTPNDLVAKNIPLPQLKSGDIIGILKSGAYGLTASPVLFLSHSLPREVIVYQGKHLLVRDHEEYQLPEIRDTSILLKE